MPPADEALPLLDGTQSATLRKRISTSKARTVDRLRRFQKKKSVGSASNTTTRLGTVLREIENEQSQSSRSLYYSVAGILAHVISATLIFMALENWAFADALYFVIVTTTTVGYGDMTPHHTFSKIYVIICVVLSLLIVSNLLSYMVDILLDQQQEVLIGTMLGEDDTDATVNADPEAAPAERTLSEKIMDATDGMDRSEYMALTLSGLWLVGILVSGVIIFMWLEKLSLIDALYVTVISASTVGFGDLSPTREVSKYMMTLWLVLSTVGLVKVIADFTDVNAKVKQRAVTRRMLTAQFDVGTFDAMDADASRSVDKLEFVTALLVRTGKIEQQEVDTLLMRFDELDKTNDGEITMSELGRQSVPVTPTSMSSPQA